MSAPECRQRGQILPGADAWLREPELRLCVDHKIELWKRGYGPSEALASLPTSGTERCSIYRALCSYCGHEECECSDADVNPDMGAK